MAILSGQKSRFLLVGILNTVVDFGILFFLTSVGVPKEIANIFSTTAAFITSYTFNKSFTFKAGRALVKRELAMFIVVTLMGIWVVQTSIMAITYPIVHPLIDNENLSLLAAKICAIGAGMVWNYLLYSRLVFKQK